MAFVVFAQYRVGTWLEGQVLPSLEDRIRVDLVPFED